MNNTTLEKFDEVLVTFFYLGKLPKAPGTFGSLGALLILFFDYINLWIYSLVILSLLILISYNSISRYEKKNGFDNPKIVIDEVIGMLIIFSNPFLNINWFWILLIFILFRTFDILKPFPINLINEKKGAGFVILDDVIAGLFSLIIIQILQVGYRILPFFSNIF